MNIKKGSYLIITAFSDPGGARTLDPLIKSQLLYQLSYGVIFTLKKKNKTIFQSLFKEIRRNRIEIDLRLIIQKPCNKSKILTFKQIIFGKTQQHLIVKANAKLIKKMIKIDFFVKNLFR